MKFSVGDIVQHIHTGQEMTVDYIINVDVQENINQYKCGISNGDVICILFEDYKFKYRVYKPSALQLISVVI